MKKTYYIPTTSVVVINVHQMLAASPEVTVNTYGSVDADKVDTRQKNNGIGSGLWSDMQ